MFSGSLVAIVTPMCADGSIDLAAWDRLLELHLASNTSGIVVGGTTGESSTIADSELFELLRLARSRIGDRMALIAGAGSSSTSATVDKVRRLAQLPLDGLLVVTPAYNKPTQEGLYQHFSAVARASTVPVIPYNVPGRTCVDMLPATVARLSRLPRISAIKEALGTVERIRELVALVPQEFAVLSGDDATACDSVLAGARGVISVTANAVPRAMSELMAAALSGDRARAAELDAPLAGLHQALFVEANPIPIKWAMVEMGLIASGIRLPLTWLSEAQQPRVRSALRAALAGVRAGAA